MASAPTETEQFDPERITAAVSLIDATVLQPILRKAADDFYCAILDATQDYLKENLDWNLKSHVEMLERENRDMRQQLHAVDSIIGPPWMMPAARIERVRELDKAASELTTLKYALAFNDKPQVAS